jgi:hypothetical protein
VAAAAADARRGRLGWECGRRALAPGEAREVEEALGTHDRPGKMDLAAARSGGEASVRHGQGRGSLFKATCAPPKD